MKYRQAIIDLSRKLRARGKTYSEIKEKIRVNVPKSTLSEWCAGVKLPGWYRKKIDQINVANRYKALKIAWTASKMKRERLEQSQVRKNKTIIQKLKNAQILKMLLAFLYLGEGSRWKSHRGLMLGSSDPVIIRLYIKLLKTCYGIKPQKLKCRISYRADQNIDSLERFLARITQIPRKNFYKTKPDPRTIGKITEKKEYKGVCVISCAGTEFQLELEMIPRIILKSII